MILECLRTDFYQIYAMMWKNMKVQLRQKKFCCCQLFIPLILLLFLFIGDALVEEMTAPTRLEEINDISFGNSSNPLELSDIQAYASALNNSEIPYKVLYSLSQDQNAISEDLVQSYEKFISPSVFTRVYGWRDQDRFLYEMQEDIIEENDNIDLALGGLTFHSKTSYTVQYEASQAPLETIELKGDIQYPDFSVPTSFCDFSSEMMNSDQCESVFVVGLMNFANRVLYNKSIVTKVAQMPFTLTEDDNLVVGNGFEVFIGMIYSMILLFPLPVYMYTLVMEKEKRIKVLLKLMGLKERNYVISNYISFLLHFVLVNCVLFYLWGYLFQHRVLTQTNFFLVVIIFIGSGFSVVSLAMFLSSFIENVVQGTLLGCFVMLFSALMSVFTRYLMTDVVLYYKFILLISPFQVVDIVGVMMIRCNQLSCLDFEMVLQSKSLIITISMLYTNAILYFLLALYLDQVIPKKVGRAKHPLFFLSWMKPLIRLVFCNEHCFFRKIFGAEGKNLRSVLLDQKEYEENKHVDEHVKELIKLIDEGETINENNRMILVKGAIKKFGSHHALKKLYFEVRPNEAYGLLGMNGAGKSTIMRILTGFFKPSNSDDRVYINGKTCSDMQNIRENVGFVPQFSILYDCLTAKEHLHFLYLFQGTSSSSKNNEEETSTIHQEVREEEEQQQKQEEDSSSDTTTDEDYKKAEDCCGVIKDSACFHWCYSLVHDFVRSIFFTSPEVIELLKKVDLYKTNSMISLNTKKKNKNKNKILGKIFEFFNQLKMVWNRYKYVLCCCCCCFMRRERLVSEMSGGMRRRLAIAISFIGKPKVLILDEPTTGLDPLSRRQVWNLLMEAKKDKTLLISSHSMEEIESICDRVGMMNEGRLICCGNIISLKDKYASSYDCKIRCDHDSAEKKKQLQLQEEQEPFMVIDEGKRFLHSLEYCEVELIHEYESMLQFEMKPLEGFFVSRLFKDMEQAKKDGVIDDWEVNRTSMDAVFLNVLAKDQKVLFSLKKKKAKKDYGDVIFDEEDILELEDIKKEEEEEKETTEEDEDSEEKQEKSDEEENSKESEEEKEQQQDGDGDDDDDEEEDVEKVEEENVFEEINLEDVNDEPSEQEQEIEEIEENNISSAKSSSGSDHGEEEQEESSDHTTTSSNNNSTDFEEEEELSDEPSQETEEKLKLFVLKSLWKILGWLLNFFTCCCVCLHLSDQFTQYVVLTKKNLILFRNQCKLCCFLLLLPIITCFLSFFYYIMVVGSYESDYFFHPQTFEPVNGMEAECVSWYDDKKCYNFIFTTNNSPLGNQVMKTILETNEDYLDNWEEIEYLELHDSHLLFEFQKEHRNSSLVGIEFPAGFDETNLEYVLYFNNSKGVLGSFMTRPDVSNVLPYWKNLIDSTIVSIVGDGVGNKDSKKIEVQLKRFPKIPSPSLGYLKGNVMAQILPTNFIIMLCFVLIVVLSRLVAEKESQQYLNMKIMGLGDVPYLCSYYVLYTILNIIMCVVFVIGGHMFRFDVVISTDVVIIFLMFFLFSQAMLIYPFIMWRYMSSRKTAVLIGFLLCIPFVFVGIFTGGTNNTAVPYHEVMPALLPYLLNLCLPPVVAFQKSFADISYLVSPVFDREENEYVKYQNFGWDDFWGTTEFREVDTKKGGPGYKITTIPFYISYLYMIYHILVGLFVVFVLQRMNISCLFPRECVLNCLDCGCNHASKVSKVFSLFKKLIKLVSPKKEEGSTDSEDDGEEKEFDDMMDHRERIELIQKNDLASEKTLASQKDMFFRIRGLKKLFFSSGKFVRAVDGLNLACRERVCLSILGHNGAGKTTTLGCVSSFHKATSGSIYINNKKVGKHNARRFLGVCNQYDILYDDLTPTQHLMLFLGIKKSGAVCTSCSNFSLLLGPWCCCFGLNSRISTSCFVQKEVDRLLNALSLYDVKDEKVKTFSGGMKRRLSVAISLIGDPSCVILDEPTTGMDPYSRSEVWDLIHQLKKEKVVILTSHSMEEVSALASKISIMKRGKLMCVGTPLSLKAKYGTGYNLKIIVEDDMEDSLLETLEGRKEKIKNCVLEECDGRVVADNGANILFRIKFEQIDGLIRVIKLLEQESEFSCMVRNFGVGQCTLEDVYLSITGNEEDDEDDEEDEEIFDSDEMMTTPSNSMRRIEVRDGEGDEDEEEIIVIGGEEENVVKSSSLEDEEKEGEEEEEEEVGKVEVLKNDDSTSASENDEKSSEEDEDEHSEEEKNIMEDLVIEEVEKEDEED